MFLRFKSSLELGFAVVLEVRKRVFKDDSD